MLKFAPKPHDEEEVNSVQPKTGMPPFVQLTAEAIEDLNISAGALRLYLLLVLYSRGFGACWPSQAELAQRLAVSERTIRSWLTKLVEASYIRIERRDYTSSSSSGEGQSNVYHLLKLVKRQPPASKSIQRSSSSDLSEGPIPVSRPVNEPDKPDSSGVISRCEVITKAVPVAILSNDHRKNISAQDEKEISGGNEPNGKIFPLAPEENFLAQRKNLAYKVHAQSKLEESIFKTHLHQTPTCTGRGEAEDRGVIPPTVPEQLTEVYVMSFEIKGQEEPSSGAIKPEVRVKPGSAAPIQARSVVSSSTDNVITASRPTLALVSSAAGLTANSNLAFHAGVVPVGMASSELAPATTLTPDPE
jgi:hypothetical protein